MDCVGRSEVCGRGGGRGKLCCARGGVWEGVRYVGGEDGISKQLQGMLAKRSQAAVLQSW